MCIIVIGEGEERKRQKTYMNCGWLKLPNLGKETNIQIQKAQKVPNKMNPKRPTLRHIIIKKSKTRRKSQKQ